MTPAWIDQAFVWVQHPFALVVFLLVAVVVLARSRRDSDKRIQAELADCWELHEHGQQEILDLTGFLMEAITLAGAPRSKQQSDQVHDLKLRVGSFQHERELALERTRAERRNRTK